MGGGGVPPGGNTDNSTTHTATESQGSLEGGRPK